MLWISTGESLGEIPNSGFDIFLHGGREDWQELVTEFSEVHGRVLIQNFFVICRYQMRTIIPYSVL